MLRTARRLADDGYQRTQALIDLHDQRADAIPDRIQALRLNHALARRLIDAQRVWVGRRPGPS